MQCIKPQRFEQSVTGKGRQSLKEETSDKTSFLSLNFIFVSEKTEIT